MPNQKKKKIALVIGAGSVKCAAALGLWKVLENEDIHFDMIVGCSGGSLYAAAMAMGFSLSESVAKTKTLWNKSVTEKRNWRGLLSAVLPGVLGFNEKFSMIDDSRMLTRLREVFGEKTFAEAQIPLYLMATDFFNGESIALCEGKIVDAIRASIAIPYVWPAWELNGHLLIDGGAANPLPVDVAIREGADIIVAIGFQSPFPSKIRSVSRYSFHINSLLTNNLYQANFSFHSAVHHAEIISIFPEFERPIRLFDTDQIPYVIEQGEKAMLEQLPYVKRLLEA
jgi:NTE family protein